MGLKETVKEKLQIFNKKWQDIMGNKKRQGGSKNGVYQDCSGRRKKNIVGDDVSVSDADMINRLKILMSIPISSAKYPKDDLDAFLEIIWKEKADVFKTEARRNVFTLYNGRLGLLRKYAREKNKIRVEDSIESMLDSLEKETIRLSSDER